MRFDLPDLAAMGAFGARIAAVLRLGDVVALDGDLGAGKTTLARGILKGAGHIGDVPSPTFTIIETYPDLAPPIVHADFYRLNHPSEVEEIGLDDYHADAALIAEWPANAGGFAHEAACLSITLETVGEGRIAIVEAGPAWQSRLP